MIQNGQIKCNFYTLYNSPVVTPILAHLQNLTLGVDKITNVVYSKNVKRSVKNTLIKRRSQ